MSDLSKKSQNDDKSSVEDLLNQVKKATEVEKNQKSLNIKGETTKTESGKIPKKNKGGPPPSFNRSQIDEIKDDFNIRSNTPNTNEGGSDVNNKEGDNKSKSNPNTPKISIKEETNMNSGDLQNADGNDDLDDSQDQSMDGNNKNNDSIENELKPMRRSEDYKDESHTDTGVKQNPIGNQIVKSNPSDSAVVKSELEKTQDADTYAKNKRVEALEENLNITFRSNFKLPSANIKSLTDEELVEAGNEIVKRASVLNVARGKGRKNIDYNMLNEHLLAAWKSGELDVEDFMNMFKVDGYWRDKKHGWNLINVKWSTRVSKWTKFKQRKNYSNYKSNTQIEQEAIKSLLKVLAVLDQKHPANHLTFSDLGRIELFQRMANDLMQNSLRVITYQLQRVMLWKCLTVDDFVAFYETTVTKITGIITLLGDLSLFVKVQKGQPRFPATTLDPAIVKLLISTHSTDDITVVITKNIEKAKEQKNIEEERRLIRFQKIILKRDAVLKYIKKISDDLVYVRYQSLNSTRDFFEHGGSVMKYLRDYVIALEGCIDFLMEPNKYDSVRSAMKNRTRMTLNFKYDQESNKLQRGRESYLRRSLQSWIDSFYGHPLFTKRVNLKPHFIDYEEIDYERFEMKLADL